MSAVPNKPSGYRWTRMPSEDRSWPTPSWPAGTGLGLFEEIHGSESPYGFSQYLNDTARRFGGAPLWTYPIHSSQRINWPETVQRSRHER